MANCLQAFRALIDHSPDAISVIDPQGGILCGSASTKKLLGYEENEIAGRNCLDLFHPDDREHSGRVLREVLGKLGPLQWEARVLQKDGGYGWVESTVWNLTFESEVRGIVMHQRDINTRRTSDLKREQQAADLVRSNERLEEFAYTAAHDLREPLRAISAYTELLMEEHVLDGNATKMAQFIVDRTSRMSKLIDDLLAFATSGIYNPPHDVHMDDAVFLAMQNLEVELKSSGAHVKIHPLPVVPGNETDLVRLFQNLIGNAAKYRGERPPVIDIFAERRGSDWVIAVKDNGAGVAPEDQDRVFMPFVRVAQRDIQGTGLGLAVCKKIVEGIGGSIWVESKPEEGSTFFFSIAAGVTMRRSDVLVGSASETGCEEGPIVLRGDMWSDGGPPSLG